MKTVTAAQTVVYDFGSIADWAAALGTVGAFVISLILLAKDLAGQRRAAAEISNAAEVQKRMQASRVFAIDPRLVSSSRTELGRPPGDELAPNMTLVGSNAVVTVVNESDHRIFALNAQIHGAIGEPVAARELSPNGELLPQYSLGPGESVQHHASFTGKTPSSETDRLLRQPLTATITFRDAAGYAWRSDSSGQLEALETLAWGQDDR